MNTELKNLKKELSTQLKLINQKEPKLDCVKLKETLKNIKKLEVVKGGVIGKNLVEITPTQYDIMDLNASGYNNVLCINSVNSSFTRITTLPKKTTIKYLLNYTTLSNNGVDVTDSITNNVFLVTKSIKLNTKKLIDYINVNNQPDNIFAVFANDIVYININDELLNRVIQRSHIYNNIANDLIDYANNTNNFNKIFQTAISTLPDIDNTNINKIIKKIMDHDANIDINLRDNVFEYTYLLRLCNYPHQQEDEKMLKLLIEKGANVNARDYRGNTPLIKASNNNYIKYVKILIENGANVNQSNNYKRTPLMVFCKNFYNKDRNTEILKLLIKNGADVNLCDYEDETALHIAILNEFTEAIKILIDNNADINKPDTNNITPLNIILDKINNLLNIRDLNIYFENLKPMILKFFEILLLLTESPTFKNSNNENVTQISEIMKNHREDFVSLRKSIKKYNKELKN